MDCSLCLTGPWPNCSHLLIPSTVELLMKYVVPLPSKDGQTRGNCAGSDTANSGKAVAEESIELEVAAHPVDISSKTPPYE